MNNNYLKKISSNFSEEGNLSSKNIDESGDIELKDLTEIDIFSSKYAFDDLFTEKMLKPECKWNEKKKAFDDLTKFTEPTKITNIKNTDRTNFNEMVKKLLKQPNINVVHSIINALNNLALGLNNNYTEAKDLFPYLIVYLKEKKESIINSLINCLSNFSLFMNDAVINEKLINYCSGKNLCNLAKINLCSLIEKIIDKKRNNIQLNSYTNLLIKISKYLEDQNPEVREKSAKLLAYINFIKKDLFNSISNSIKLDNKKKDKIFEYEKLFINFSYNKNAQSNEKKVNKNKEKIKEINSNLEPKNTDIYRLAENDVKEVDFTKFVELFGARPACRNEEEAKKLYSVFLGDYDITKKLSIKDLARVANELELELAEDEIEEMIRSLNPETQDCISFEEFYRIMSKMNV